MARATQKLPIEVPRDRVADFCRRHHIVELGLFGSVLRDDFRADSDVDVLVTFDPRKKPSLLTFAAMQSELEEILGRKVDLLERCGMEQSTTDPDTRQHVLDTLEIVHAD